jgi:hypothetical protein
MKLKPETKAVIIFLAVVTIIAIIATTLAR